jgi:hypothetical protein
MTFAPLSESQPNPNSSILLHILALTSPPPPPPPPPPSTLPHSTTTQLLLPPIILSSSPRPTPTSTRGQRFQECATTRLNDTSTTTGRLKPTRLKDNRLVEVSFSRVGFGRPVGGRVVGGRVDGLPVCSPQKTIGRHKTGKGSVVIGSAGRSSCSCRNTE